MESARHAEPGFSPLDDELALVSGSLSPTLEEHVVRLGASLPFARAAKETEAFRRVSVSLSTVRRHTLKAGTALVEWAEQEVERLERDAPEPPLGPERMVLSVDGAMVPLVGGEWAEVKTLALGVVNRCPSDATIQTSDWSYFSRLTDAETFGRWALEETDRRGLATAQQVAAVTDGAEWIQSFVDDYRPDAFRILDFPHAAQRVTDLSAALEEGKEQLAARWSRLKTEGPETLLSEWRSLLEERPTLGETLRPAFQYLTQREAHLQYPRFQQEGWPIGSGSVESANKLVVEARLKGSGMHWKRENVNPMLALRNALCNDRWNEAWKEITDSRHTSSKPKLRVPSSPLGSEPSASPPPPQNQGLTAPLLRRAVSRSSSPHPWRQFRDPSVSYFSSAKS